MLRASVIAVAACSCLLPWPRASLAGRCGQGAVPCYCGYAQENGLHFCQPLPQHQPTNDGGFFFLPLAPGGFDETGSRFLDPSEPGLPPGIKGFGGFHGPLGAFETSPSGLFIVGRRLGKDHLFSFVPSGDRLTLVQELALSSPLRATAPNFGSRKDLIATTADGRVLRYSRNSGRLTLAQSFNLPPQGGAGARPAGVALATGKRNGDAFEDLLVGVPNQTVNGKKDAGVVYEYLGTAQGLSTTPNRTYRRGLNRVPGSPLANERFGEQISLIDFDNSGLDNLFIGVPHGFGGTGAFYLERKDGFFFAQTLGGGRLPGSHFGWAVTQARLNGDPFPDFVVGAPGLRSGTLENAGAIYVYLGSASLPVFRQAMTAAVPLAQTTPLAFGTSLDAFDATGAGTDQIFVGAPCFDLPGKPNAGAVVPVNLLGVFSPIHLDRGAIAGTAFAEDFFGGQNGSYPLGGTQALADLCAGR